MFDDEIIVSRTCTKPYSSPERKNKEDNDERLSLNNNLFIINYADCRYDPILDLYVHWTSPALTNAVETGSNSILT